MSSDSRGFPGWAKRTRLADLGWIRNHLHVLWPAAQKGYATGGRGALYIDAAAEPTAAGYPFWYVLERVVAGTGDPDALRMVVQYDPGWEMVIVFLKAEQRTSTYRVGVKKPGA